VARPRLEQAESQRQSGERSGRRRAAEQARSVQHRRPCRAQAGAHRQVMFKKRQGRAGRQAAVAARSASAAAAVGRVGECHACVREIEEAEAW